MKHINDDNIDEIMFQLLEGDITGLERENLLQAIHSDQKYLALWNTWQQTILQNEEIPFELSNLKRKTSLIVPLYIKYAAAAVLIFGLIILLNRENIKQDDMVIIPPKIKTFSNPLPKIQEDTIYNKHLVRDTLIPLKEKVKYMADKPASYGKSIIENQDIPKNYTAQFDDLDSIVLVKNTPEEITPEKAFEEEIFVSISTDNSPGKKTKIKNNGNFLAKLLGKSSIKIEPDHNTRTKRKIIFENKKYQIIAGF